MNPRTLWEPSHLEELMHRHPSQGELENSDSKACPSTPLQLFGQASGNSAVSPCEHSLPAHCSQCSVPQTHTL